MENIDRLECVYYPGPVPKNGAVLMTLCFVFDKIYFPRVYLPKGDYDKNLLNKEIERLKSLETQDYDVKKLIGILRFLEYRLPLDGILEYPSAPDSIFGRSDETESKLARKIYDLNFPPRENFEPIFEPSSLKSLPESNEGVIHAGEFHYQAGAVIYAAQKGIPLIDDGSWFPLPFRAQYKDNAQALAALIAIESMELVLPDLPVLSIQELVDFRQENKKELCAFRAAMLRYTQTINSEISEDMPAEEVARKTKFLVDTEIAPALHDLNRDLQNPNRPWFRRFADGVRISSSVLTGWLTGGLVGQTAAEGIKEAMLAELEGKGMKRETIRRNGLCYLLKAKVIKDA